MGRLRWFLGWMERLPIRWRLALVSFGLLAVLLAALGILISVTEEDTLLDSQATVLNNEVHFAQMQLEVTKTPLQAPQIRAFPAMSKGLASGWASAIHATLGQNVGVSILSFDGNVLATDTNSSNDPSLSVVT